MMEGEGEHVRWLLAAMSSPFISQNRHRFLFGLTVIAAGIAASPAWAIDALAHKTDIKNIFLIYDIPSAQLTQEQVKDYVYKALTSHGDDAKAQDLMLSGSAPAQPGKMEFKTLQFLTQTIRYPSCGDQAVFVVGSSDQSGSKWGDESNYMACGYRYEGGYRVNLYASFSQKQSGIFSLGATLAKAAASAMGMKSEPIDFILGSLDTFESELKQANLPFSIIEMTPALPGREVVPDPLLVRQQTAAKQSTDRAKRLAARGDLSKLGYDAADRAKLIKAIQSGDEDVVALYVEAGAIDLSSSDDSGKHLSDYATKPAIKALLVR